jgi:hypothetical protein
MQATNSPVFALSRPGLARTVDADADAAAVMRRLARLVISALAQ